MSGGQSPRHVSRGQAASEERWAWPHAPAEADTSGGLSPGRVRNGRSSAVLGREPDAEADEHGAGDEVEHAARARAAEDVADARDLEDVHRQPRQADEAEEHAEQHERGEARL